MNRRRSQSDPYPCLAEHPLRQVNPTIRQRLGGAGAPPSNKKGFTLIELLVVIAILSLLVSILLPSLQKAKLLARRVLCLTRLKSIGSSLYLYMNDNHDRGPIGFSYGGDSFNYKYPWSGWPNETPDKDPSENPYRSGYGWFCGDSTLKDTSPWNSDPCNALGTYLGIDKHDIMTKIAVACPNYEYMVYEGEITPPTTYAVNYYLGFCTYLGDHVEKPASTPMLMDGACTDLDGDPTMDYTMFPRPPYGIEDVFLDMATYSHENTGNFLFFDGHAENQAELETALDYANLWTFYGD
ncbi:MAG: prepilin-type N-terminal cleavage/methylation domain-containing protein [Phycisphaerae bacterium]|nr:prepilin-type N-terminal cleavage/methylation domain-containing protein [Phycisphaerae bacterium]